MKYKLEKETRYFVEIQIKAGIVKVEVSEPQLWNESELLGILARNIGQVKLYSDKEGRELDFFDTGNNRGYLQRLFTLPWIDSLDYRQFYNTEDKEEIRGILNKYYEKGYL